MAAKNDLSLPHLVAAGSLLGNLIQTSRNGQLSQANQTLQGQLEHFMDVLRQWQAAHQGLRATADRQRHQLDEQESLIERLRNEVAQLTAKLAEAEAALARKAGHADGAVAAAKAPSARHSGGKATKRGRK